MYSRKRSKKQKTNKQTNKQIQKQKQRQIILESDKGVYFVKLFLINRHEITRFKTTCKVTRELSFDNKYTYLLDTKDNFLLGNIIICALFFLDKFFFSYMMNILKGNYKKMYIHSVMI